MDEADLTWSILTVIFTLIMAIISAISASYSARRASEVKINTLIISALAEVQMGIYEAREFALRYDESTEDERKENKRTLRQIARTLATKSASCDRLMSEADKMAKDIGNLSAKFNDSHVRSRFLYRSRLFLRKIRDYNHRLVQSPWSRLRQKS